MDPAYELLKSFVTSVNDFDYIMPDDDDWCDCWGVDGQEEYHVSGFEGVDTAAEYKGRKVTLNKPFRTSGGPKKFAVYTKNESGNVVLVRFGSKDMEIRRDNPVARKSFRARHNCDNPGPKWKSKYWSCRQWRSGYLVED